MSSTASTYLDGAGELLFRYTRLNKWRDQTVTGIKAIKTYLAAEKLYQRSPAAWVEALYTAAYDALVALATAGDEDVTDFLAWRAL
jgi:hypothetical protein